MQRVCSACGVSQDIDHFYRDASATGGREYRCKACARRHRRKMLERTIDKRTKLIRSLKEEGCRICQLAEFPVLEFHHVIDQNPTSISRMVYGAYGERAFLEELSKCVIVCANDHKRVHAGLLTADAITRYSVEELYERYHKEKACTETIGLPSKQDNSS